MSKTKPIKKQKVSKSAQIVDDEKNNSYIFPIWLPISVVLGITFLAFFPTLQNDFVNWDDDVNILKNSDLEGSLTLSKCKDIFTHTIMGGYNPFSILTFALEKAIFGVENWAKVIHTNNLLLHLGVVYLVYQLVLRLNLNIWTAFFTALLFGIHPMRVESVAWATERKDVLLGIFYFLAIIEYIKYLKLNEKIFNKNIILTYLFFILALFSKIQAVALPLTLLAFDYFFDRNLKKAFFEKIPFFMIALLWGGLSIWFLKAAKTIQLDGDMVLFSFFERLGIAGYAYFIYLVKCIYPYIMACVYPYPAKIPIYFYGGTLLGFATLWFIYDQYLKQNKLIVFGFAFFILNFMFVSQLVGAGQAFLADRFTYIAYFGLFLMIIEWINCYIQNTNNYKIAINGILIFYVIICCSMTYQQTQTWKNGETLWTQALKYDANSSLPYGNRAIYFREQKDFKKAIPDFDKAIAISGKAGTLNSRGKTFFDMGENDKAISDYNLALSKDSSIAEVWVNRAAALGKAGRYEAALSDANKGLYLDNKLLNGYAMRSLIYQSMGKWTESLADNIAYLQLKPEDADTWFDSGILRRQLKQDSEALVDFTKAISINAQKGEYYLERAKLYLSLGNIEAKNQDVLVAKSKGIKIPEGL
jgi:tetratricopeptide (TPR) repeat protein